MMSTLEEIEAAIKTLPPEDFGKLLKWMDDRDPDAWDRQMEADSQSGKLDHLIEQARERKRQGQCKPL